jgi:hypothetical protein
MNGFRNLFVVVIVHVMALQFLLGSRSRAQCRGREEKDLAKCIEAATKHTKLDGCQSSHTSASIDIEHVVREYSQQTDPDM